MQIFTRTLDNGKFEILWINPEGMIVKHFYSLTRSTIFPNTYDKFTLDLIYDGKFTEISDAEAEEMISWV